MTTGSAGERQVVTMFLKERSRTTKTLRDQRWRSAILRRARPRQIARALARKRLSVAELHADTHGLDDAMISQGRQVSA